MNKDIYIICHSSTRIMATELATMFESDNITCSVTPLFTDDVYDENFPDIISSYKIVIAVISQYAQESQRILFECNATENLKKVFFPVMTSEFSLSKELAFILSNVQRFEAFNDPDVITKDLKNAVYKVLGREINYIPEKIIEHKSTVQETQPQEIIPPPQKELPNEIVVPKSRLPLPFRILFSPFIMLSHIFKKDPLSQFINPAVKLSLAPIISCWLLPLFFTLTPSSSFNIFQIMLLMLFFIFTHITYSICLGIVKRKVSRVSIVWLSFFYSVAVNMIGILTFVFIIAFITGRG